MIASHIPIPLDDCVISGTLHNFCTWILPPESCRAGWTDERMLKARPDEDGMSVEGCVLRVVLEPGTFSGTGMLCLTLTSSLEEASEGFSPVGLKRQGILISFCHPSLNKLASDIAQTAC